MNSLKLRAPKRGVDWPSFQQEWKDCSRCQIGVWAHKHVLGSGPLDAKIVFIGEGPGQSENTLGLPFIGRAGRLLRKAIKSAGGDPDACAYTNVVACRPCDTQLGGNRPPKEEEAKNCAPRLTQFLSMYQDLRVLVLCGKVPEAYLLAPLIRVTTAKQWVGCIPHPAHIARQGGVNSQLWQRYVDSIRGALGRTK